MKTKILFLVTGVVIALASLGAYQWYNTGCILSAIPGNQLACNADATAASAKSCGKPALAAIPLSEFSSDEQKILNYIVDVTTEAKGDINKVNAKDTEPGTISNKTGVALNTVGAFLFADDLLGGIISVLNKRGFDGAALVANIECVKYQACSVDANLSTANAEDEALYAKEKSEDGKKFADKYAPDFLFQDMAGETKQLSDYRGKKVALMLFAIHCNHCYKTLPVISKLKDQYATDDITILPVYVNKKGGVKIENLKILSTDLKLNYGLLVAKTEGLSDLFESRIVPTTFLIDEKGRITQKFVGQKDLDVLREAFDDFIQS